MSRPVSFFERYYIHRDVTGVMNRGFNVSVQYGRPISDALLLNALRDLIPTHYYFYTNAFRLETDAEESALLDGGCKSTPQDERQNGQNWELRPVERVLYLDVVRKVAVEEFDDAVFEHLSHVRIPVNVQRPTYYLTLLEEKKTGLQYVVFSSNHMLFDGTSAVHFLQDLSHKLAQNSGQVLQPAEVLFERDHADVVVELPADKKTTLYSSSRWWKFCAFLKLAVPDLVLKVYRSYFSSNFPNFFRDPLLNVASFKSGSASTFKMVRYSPAETAQILQKCRQNGTTVTALLTAQLLACVQEAFLPHLGPFSSSISIAVSGRRYFPDLDLRYGLYISAVTEYLRTSSVLTGAAQLNRAMKQCFETRNQFMFTGLLDYVNIWKYMQEKIDSHKRGTIEVSNLGVVSMQEKDWEPLQVFFSQSVTDTHFVCSCVSTKSGGLNIMVAYHKLLDNYAWRGEKTAQKCIDTFRSELLE